MSRAVVVGAGPNGLVAAVILARAGLEVTVLEAAADIGGGTRTVEGIVPGLLHDQCSAVHPMAVASPALLDLGLDRHGLQWRWPEIDCVHPLDGGRAGVLHRSVATTADGLGADGRRWRQLFDRPSAGYDELAADILGPVLHVPAHPLRLARFGLPTLLPAAVVARAFRTEEAQALWGGVAAHAYRPLDRPLTSAIGLGIITAGHRHGWPVAAGGSASITRALAAELDALGGKIETGVRVTSAAQLDAAGGGARTGHLASGRPPAADVTLFDLAPAAVAEILGDRLPARTARAYRRFRHGPGAFKVDFAVEGGVPWTHPAARAAGTVHLGGAFAEIAANEAAIHAGRMPERPFVLVAQQYLADPERSAGDIHPVWSYAHVPAGYEGDATEAIITQFERFAPGFRERIVGLAVRTTTDLARHNPNFVDGDILTGAKTASQMLLGPRPGRDPYATGLVGTWLCSAATPPGPGAHGMCGANAAARALRHLRRSA